MELTRPLYRYLTAGLKIIGMFIEVLTLIHLLNTFAVSYRVLRMN